MLAGRAAEFTVCTHGLLFLKATELRYFSEQGLKKKNPALSLCIKFRAYCRPLILHGNGTQTVFSVTGENNTE